MAATAFDAEVLINARLGDIVEVEILPVADLTDCHATKIIQRLIALGVHPVGQTVDHFFNDFEAIGHGSSANLNRAATKRNKLSRIAPCGDASNA